MKKVLLKSALMIAKPSSITSESTYHQRKAMQPAYRELFRALLLLPDKEVQQRVLDAINGPKHTEAFPQPRILCARCKGIKRATASTQTEPNNVEKRFKMTTVLVREQRKPLNCLVSPQKTAEEKKTLNYVSTPKKSAEAPQLRRRKRKICLPQVIKRSQAQQAQQHLMPKIKQPKLQKPAEKVEVLVDPHSSAGDLCDYSYGPLSPVSSLSGSKALSPLELLIQTMAKEYQMADMLQGDGLLPIHDAIAKNNMLSLQRQIFVWKTMKEMDLNDVLTDNEEDCLQLAVMNNCSYEILEILLEAGLNANSIDEYSNTIVHLALINQIELNSLDSLMRNIDLETLLQLNDDGFTPLHVAVRNNLKLHTELMLNVIDERLLGHRIYSRQDYEHFHSFYRNVCDYVDIYRKGGDGLTKLKVKMKLLGTGEMRSGNTALFFAIDNKMEDFIYLLLAHLIDPRIPNHSGQDAKSYFGEFGRVLNLTLHIDKIMEKVIKIIKL